MKLLKAFVQLMLGNFFKRSYEYFLNLNNDNNNNLIAYIAQVFIKMIKCALHW